MNGLIRFALGNPWAITVLMLTIVLAGGVALISIPADILPVYRKPAVQVMTFYGGMSATNVEKDITARMERWTGQAAGTERQESRSIIGASVIRNYYAGGIDESSALAQVNSLSTAAIPNLPPGTLPPVVLPFDPTGTTPVCMVALNSKSHGQSALYDVARYEVRNFIMALPGSNAPVVYGGKVRTVLAYIDRDKMQARNLSPVEVMNALNKYNVFLPAGDAKFGATDYALDSNSMYEIVERMGGVPIKTDKSGTVFLRDIAKPRDAAMIQTTIVRVEGRKQVYIPVYRQQGSSTLSVVNAIKEDRQDMQDRLSTGGVDLEVVMDQSIYVRKAIESLAEEGILGAVLCSMVILLFLGQWRMTMIAVMTIPVAVLGAIACLYGLGQTINVMTLAGLALAVGPLVDSAIICLENTERHIRGRASPKAAAFLGASEVAVPELVASLCTLLVLLPLALMPGLGPFLFRPMFFAVAFAMAIAYLLSRTFVPTRCAAWLRGHDQPRTGEPHVSGEEHGDTLPSREGWGSRIFKTWMGLIDAGIKLYSRALERVMRARWLVIGAAVTILVLVVLAFGLNLRREFFPEVDAGAFEVYARCPSGTRIEVTEGYIEAIENYLRRTTGSDLKLVISEIGVTPDWSAAYTPNSGSMDAVLHVQLVPDRQYSAQEHVTRLRKGFASDPEFENELKGVYARRRADTKNYPFYAATPEFSRTNVEFAFDSGGLIRSAMNEGKSTPINIQITTKAPVKAQRVAEELLTDVRNVNGVVDARIIQRLNYPEYILEVDQAKSADLGLTQRDVMENLVAAFNSSIAFNKTNFWIDPKSHNQYYVGVQYEESSIASLETMLDVPITSSSQRKPIPLRNIATIRRTNVPSEVTHTNLQSTIDITMGVERRDLGHVAADVQKLVARYGKKQPKGDWTLYDPDAHGQNVPMTGSKITISGEYQKMQNTFRYQGYGMIGAVILIYFLMAALFKSYLTPLVILSAVPIGVVGVVLMLFVTGTALNVQSLLGVIFMVGIVVSNTVLLTDFAQNLRITEKLTPTEAIKKAASIRVRPVCMTAMATFFALVPMSIGLSRGSEANVPLGRAVLGGLLAGLVTTLFVVPCLYSLMVPNRMREDNESLPGDPGYKEASTDQQHNMIVF